MAKADKGDKAAKPIKETAFKAMNDETKAGNAFVVGIERSWGRRLPLTARVGLIETYEITRSILRIVRQPARAAPEAPAFLERLIKEADGVVCVGRWSDFDGPKRSDMKKLFKVSKTRQRCFDVSCACS